MTSALAARVRRTRRAGAPRRPSRRRRSRGRDPTHLATLSRSSSTLQRQLVAGTDEASEPRLLDATEQRQLVGVALVAEHADRAGLRERLELQHAGKDRIAREVAGEERLLARDPVPGDHRLPGDDLVDRVDEAERRTVRQQRDRVHAAQHGVFTRASHAIRACRTPCV